MNSPLTVKRSVKKPRLARLKEVLPIVLKGIAYCWFYSRQMEAFTTLRDAQFGLLNTPTGWGKTLVQKFICLWKLCADPKAKLVIAIPRWIIAAGFLGGGLQLLNALGINRLAKWVGTDKVCWAVGLDLCGANDARKKLVHFLRTPVASGLFNSSRICLTTHQNLAYFWEKHRRKIRLKHVILCIDEAHHSLNAEVKGKKGQFVRSRMGALITHFLNSDPKDGLQLLLATATYGRGDLHHIIDPDAAERLIHVKIPFDEYFRDLKELESFSYNAIVAANCTKAFGAIIRRPLNSSKLPPTLAILAPRGSADAGCKFTEVKTLVREIARVHNGKVVHDDRLILIECDGYTIKILDLVTPRGRNYRRTYLDGVKTADDLHFVLALEYCNEGFDWPPCARCIMFGERNSLPQRIQIFGRLFRDVPGKRKVELYQLLGYRPGRGTETHRKYCSQVLTAVMSSMQMVDIFLPIPISGSKQNPLGRQIKSLNKRLEFDNEAQRLLMKISVEHQDEADTSTAIWREFHRQFPAIAAKYGVTEDVELVCRQEYAKYALLTKRFQGIAVDRIPFDKLKMGNPMEGAIQWATENMGIATLEELKDCLHGVQKADLQTHQKEVRKAGITSQKAYRAWPNRPPELHVCPNSAMRAFGVDSEEFFGRRSIQNKADLQTHQKEMRKAGIRSQIAYKEWTNRPPELHANPQNAMKVFGLSYEEFYGKPSIQNKADLQTHQKEMRKAGIASHKAYKGWPNRPPQLYANSQQAMEAFGVSFEELFERPSILNKADLQTHQKEMRKAGIASPKAYKEWPNRPPELYSVPDNAMRAFNAGHEEFFGRPSRKYKADLQTHKKEIRKAGIRSQKAYKEWPNRPPNLYQCPWKAMNTFRVSIEEFFGMAT